MVSDRQHHAKINHEKNFSIPILRKLLNDGIRMWNLNFFYTKKVLEKEVLNSFVRSCFKVSEILWVEDFMEYSMDNIPGSKTIYISKEEYGEGFCVQYKIWNYSETTITVSEWVNSLCTFARTNKTEILTSDEEVNPWTYIHIEADGCAYGVNVEDDDILKINGHHSFSPGEFAACSSLSALEMEQLRTIVNNVYPNCDIEFYDNINWKSFPGLYKDQFKDFKFFYTLSPKGKLEWQSRKEASDTFVELILSFCKASKLTLCVFPRDYSEVRNIPGGSDSEEYCLLMDSNGYRKFVYKYPRASW